jgi:low affinity Fe/Cu permease
MNQTIETRCKEIVQLQAVLNENIEKSERKRRHDAVGFQGSHSSLLPW